MAVPDEKTIQREYVDLLRRSGFPITDTEWEAMEISDFGLGNLHSEGFAFIDILRSARLRITLIALLPNQTLPQHVHPPYEGEPGKEETLRVLSGQTRVYIKGKATAPGMLIPAGKEPFYTARQEICLNPGEQYTVPPVSSTGSRAARKGRSTSVSRTGWMRPRTSSGIPKASAAPSARMTVESLAVKQGKGKPCRTLNR